MTKVSEKVATRQSGGHLETTRCVNSALVLNEGGLFRQRLKLMRRLDQRQQQQQQRQRQRRQHCWLEPDLKTGNSSNTKKRKSYKYKNPAQKLVAATLGISSAYFDCWHRANSKRQFASSHWSSSSSSPLSSQSRKKASIYLCCLMSHFILYFILLLHLNNQLKPQLLEAAKFRQNFPPNIGYDDGGDATAATNFSSLEVRTKAQSLALTTFHHNYHRKKKRNNNTSRKKTLIERSRFQKQQQQQQLLPETDLNVSTLANSLSNVTGESNFFLSFKQNSF